MSKPTMAKHTRPRLNGALPRERLFTRFDEWRGGTTIWVSGPPGAGKTLSVAGWIEARTPGTAWVRLDAGDRDPTGFFSSLAEALPRTKAKAPLLQSNDPADVRSAARTFFRRYFADIGASGVLVLDDAHTALDSLTAVLQEAANELPSGVTLVVIARDAPPAAFARLELDGAIRRLDWHALQLDQEETRAIVRRGGITEADMIRDFSMRSGGWAAGLRLLIERYRAYGDLPTGDADSASLFGYFAEEIFNALESATRDTLLKTALLPDITPAQAESLTGVANAGRLLESLSQRQLFIERLTGSPLSYRLHGLFRAFLQSQLRARLDSVELIALQRQSAKLLVAAQRLGDAIPLLCECGDWVAAGRLVIREAPGMLACGRVRTIRAWLQNLPPWYVAVTPRLLYCLGVAQLSEDPVTARDTLAQAYARFRASRDALGEALTAASVIQSYYFAFDDYRGIDRWARSLQEALGRDPVFPTAEAELHVQSMLQMALTCQGPNDPEVLVVADRVLALIARGLEVNQTVAAASVLMTLLDQMAPEKARMLVAIVTPRLSSPTLTAFNRVWWNLATCYHSSHEGDPERVRQAAREIEALGEAHGIRPAGGFGTMLRMFEHFSGVDTALEHDAVLRCGALLDPKRRQEAMIYHIYASYFSLSQGHPATAIELAQRAVAFARETSHRCSELDGLEMLAYAHIGAGDGPAALEAIHQARLITGPLQAEKLQFGFDLAESAARFVASDRPGALTVLKSAMRVGRAHGFMRTHYWIASTMSMLCARALEAEIEPRYVAALIAHNHLAPPNDSLSQRWPWPVRVSVLGPTEIRIGDTPLEFRGKAQKKPLELMQYLVAQGPAGTDLALAASDLWPDSDGDAAESALRMNVHRLRKLLGNDNAVTVRDGAVCLDRKHCWVDAWTFECLAGRLAGPGSARPEATADEELTRQTVALYRGPAFDRERTMPWMLAIRERLRARFLALVSACGQAASRAGRVTEATELYRRGIDADPLCEGLYQALMRCLLDADQASEAYAVYRQCRETLSVVLGIAPAPRTEALRQEAAIRREPSPAALLPTTD